MTFGSALRSDSIAQEVSGSRASFLELTKDVASQQATFLHSIIQRNRHTQFGLRFDFSGMQSVADFQATVPITSYAQIATEIEATAAGAEGVLMPGRAVVMEPTGGSGATNTSGAKLIAYSEQSLFEFQAMVRPWLDDLFQTYPTLAGCSAYWSISPAVRATTARQNTNAVPIGLPTDAHYLGDALGQALFLSLSVPPSVGSITDHDKWALTTLCYLLADEKLGLVSVWSPTFWLDLTTTAFARSSEVLDAFETIGVAISVERLTFLRKHLGTGDFNGDFNGDFSLIWPDLKVISCWADASAQTYIPVLQARFPLSVIQGKGLLATEGAMSFPLSNDQRSYVHVLAINSGFFEFMPLDKAGLTKLAHELAFGEQYRIILTNSSGLYRYDMGDEIEVTGFVGSAPCFKFLGRGTAVVDLCGEKLSESFVAQAIVESLQELGNKYDEFRRGGHRVRCAVLLPVADIVLARGYQLVVDTELSAEHGDFLAEKVDAALQANPQYEYARKIGQLQPLQIEFVATLQQQWLARALARGQQLGDVKPPVLTQDSSWLKM
jgi:hypothetical protein